MNTPTKTKSANRDFPIASPGKMAGESNSFNIPAKGGRSNTFKVPAVKNSTAISNTFSIPKTGGAVSNAFNIKKAGRDYPLSESPNPTFNNQK